MQKEKPQQSHTEKKSVIEPTKKPNEQTGIYFSSSIKITDPDTGKILLNIRGD